VQHFSFDWSINVGTVTSVLLLLGTIVNYGRKVLSYLKTISFRVNVMWEQFEKDHPDVVRNIHRFQRAER
jgi:hypothetical protein